MTDPGRELVAAIADSGAVDDILRTHVADGRGRCEGCSLDDRLRPPWPCGPRGLAEKAAESRAPRPRWVTP